MDEVEKFHKEKVKVWCSAMSLSLLPNSFLCFFTQEKFAKLEPVESDQGSDEISDVRL